MQQRQLRLGDILDDYCPRERRITNHAVVAMIGPEIKQTRCTTCDTEHVYKQAKVPRQRRKSDAPAALYSQVLAGAAPKRVSHDASVAGDAGHNDESAAGEPDVSPEQTDAPLVPVTPEPIERTNGSGRDVVRAADAEADAGDESDEGQEDRDDSGPLEEGPVHRPLIRATLPRPEGQPPPTRPAPEFTIRQPGSGRPGRFRPRHPNLRGGASSFSGSGNRHGQGNLPGGGMPRHGGHPPMTSRAGKRHGPPGRKRSK
jgi:hypothetical protein